MPGWSETDLEGILNDPFANDGPLVFGGTSTGCVIKTNDIEQGGLGTQSLTDATVECHYATGAFLKGPTIGDTVTVDGASYLVRHKMNKSAGMSCLYLAAL